MPRWMKGVLLAGAIAGTGLGIAAGIMFRVYREPSTSMWPTLRLGDRLVAHRLELQPVRGAIVVFRYPERPDQSFVKRIIGLPGDVVAVDHGVVSINGWTVPRCVVGTTAYTDDGAVGDSGSKHAGTLAVEFLGDASYLVFEEKLGLPGADASQHWAVAPGQYFVLGDNRNNSHDSRMWFGGAGGGVPFANTQGRLKGYERPAVPPHADNAATLAPALAACLARRPGETTPPPPK